ncbi:MAG: Fe-S protein assembly co-chaperone HscB [Nitrospirae bacterium]|nr:Fe-S protein assembly co-chaperone HscB [Candidatus Manganitrophaceae bacterium]
MGRTELLTKRTCWKCGAEIESLSLCDRCAALQPIPAEADYFTLFHLGAQLKIDLPQLQAKFYELSRAFHPDFYQKKSAEEQAISLENSAIVNKAYRTLRDPVQRAEYLIQRVEGGGAISTEAPADLFDEIFEVQELLEEAKEVPSDPAERDRLLRALREAQVKFEARQEEGRQALDQFSSEWDRLQDARHNPGDADLSEEQKRILAEIKRILSHRGYLERVIDNLEAGIEKLKGEKGT